MNNDGEICEEKIPMETPSANICKTRSCAALRAADLDWIVRPLDHSFAKYYVLSNHNNFGQEGAGINKNVTDTFRQ